LTGRQIAAIRASFIAAAILIIAFRWIHLEGDPGAVDPWSERIALSVFFLAATGLTWWPPVHEYLPELLMVAASATVLLAVRIALLNAFSIQTVVGLLTVIACGSTSMRGRATLGGFLAFTLVAVTAGFALAKEPRLPGAFVIPHIVTIGLFAFLLAGSRQRAQRDLAQSESLRRFMLDQTSDALFIIDPIRRIAVEHNGPARDLFELGDSPDPAAAAAAAFGETVWGAIDAVLMLKDTSGGQVVRRERVYDRPGGTRFDGALVVTQIRYGLKIMLLARVSDISERVELARRLRKLDVPPAGTA
jgi:PAS domain-containing protein